MPSPIVVVAQISPQLFGVSDAAAKTGWLKMSAYQKLKALIVSGDLNGGEVALTLEQAKSSTGTAAKALAGGTTLNVDNSNKAVDIDLATMDTNGGFTHFRASLATNGAVVANAACSLVILGLEPRYSDVNPVDTAETAATGPA